MTNEEKENSFDKFELIAAIMLGLAAIGTALASFQSALWGGKSVEAYGRANTEATKASSERSRAIVEMSKDATVDIQAARLVWEGDDTTNQVDKDRAFRIATYLYTKQISDPAYKALKLPPEAKKELVDDPQTPEDEDKQAAIQEKVLENAMDVELIEDENYRKEMLAESVKLSEQSEKTFKEGQDANEAGDKFDFVNVIFAISLFFVGISLIFRTSIRWVLLGLGSLAFIAAAIYMATLSWTSL
jgi:formiminotetrahydrofolate cyclodeaminase